MNPAGNNKNYSHSRLNHYYSEHGTYYCQNADDDGWEEVKGSANDQADETKSDCGSEFFQIDNINNIEHEEQNNERWIHHINLTAIHFPNEGYIDEIPKDLNNNDEDIDEIDTDLNELINESHKLRRYISKNFHEFFNDAETPISALLLQFTVLDIDILKDNSYETDEFANNFVVAMRDPNKSKLFSSILYQATAKWMNKISNTSNGDNKQALLNKYATFFQKVSYLCAYILSQKISDRNHDKQIITRIYLECHCARLTLQTLDNDEIKKEFAQNELYLLKKTIHQIEKGVATLNGQLTKNADLENMTSIIPSIAGNEFVNADQTVESELKLSTEETEPIDAIDDAILILGKLEFNKEHKIEFKFLNKYESLMWHEKSILPTPIRRLIEKPTYKKYSSSNLSKIQHEIKLILREIHNQKTIFAIDKLKERYLNCLLNIEQQIENNTLRPAVLQDTTVTAELPWGKYRTTVLGALKELSDEFDIHGNYPKNEELSASNNVNTINDIREQQLAELDKNRHKRLNNILNECYKENGDSCQGLNNIQVTKFTKNLYKNCDFKSRVSIINMIHKVLFIINQSKDTTEIEKSIFIELLFIKISTIEALNRHRNPLNVGVGIFTILGICCNNFSVATPYQWSGEVFFIEPIGASVESTGFNLMKNPPGFMLTTTTTARSIMHQTSIHHNKLIISFINKQLLNEINLTATTLEEKINEFIQTNLNDSEIEFQTYVKKSILDYGIPSEGKVAPLILVISEHTTNQTARDEIFRYYCRCTLESNPNQYKDKFNELLTSSKRDTYEAAIDLCLMLAIIAYYNVNDSYLAQSMSNQLVEVLDRSIKDKISNWHKLVISKQLDNLIRKFIITAFFYVATIVAITFAITITPFAPIINILLLSIILISLRCIRDWLTRTFESLDTSIIEVAKHNLQNHDDYIPSKLLNDSPLIESYQYSALNNIIEDYYENHRMMNLFVKALIAFLIEQTHDSKSLIENLELIKDAINALKLPKEDLEFILLKLRNALKDEKLNKILKYEPSNNLLTTITTAIILSIGDILSISGVPFFIATPILFGVTVLRVGATETDFLEELCYRLGFIPENERLCNKILDGILVPQGIIDNEIIVPQKIDEYERSIAENMLIEI